MKRACPYHRTPSALTNTQATKLAAALEQVAAAEPSLAAMRSDLAAATARGEQLSGQYAASSARADSLAAQLADATSRVAELSERLAAAEARLKDLGTTLAAREQEVSRGHAWPRGRAGGRVALDVPNLGGEGGEIAQHTRARTTSTAPLMTVPVIRADSTVCARLVHVPRRPLRPVLTACQPRASSSSPRPPPPPPQASSLRATVDAQEADVADLGARNGRMQGLIKDMAGQMEVLQGSLAKQTALVAKLEAALEAAGMQAAEIEDISRTQAIAYK